MTTWLEHVARWRDCQLCPLAQQRDNIVLARGTVPCDVLFVGEAPGVSEDALGLPFVGPAGQLLDQVVDRALGSAALCATCGGIRFKDGDDWTCGRGHARRDGHGGRDVSCAFTNLVACFPAEAKAEGINMPEIAEIKACRPRLEEFIGVAQPRLVVLVGGLANEWVRHDAYGRIGGTASVVHITHPAAILRMPLAQKQMATQRCVVQIKNAVEEAMER